MRPLPSNAESLASDYSRSKGINLLHLLGLNDKSRVLIIGGALECWRGNFQNCHFSPVVPFPTEIEETYNLVLYHSDCAASRKDLVSQLQGLKNHPKINYHFLIFGRNFFSFSNLKRVKSFHRKSLHAYSLGIFPGYHQALSEADLTPVTKFLTFPDLESSEELVVPDSQFVELPHNWHPLLHLAHRIGCYEFFAEGIVYLVSQNHLEESDMFHALISQISSAGVRKVRQLTLERFDLRSRGVLVLFLSESDREQNFIARVVSDLPTWNIVRHNQAFLKYLHSHINLPEVIKDLLPYPFGDLSWNGCNIFLETLVKGVLAWKVNSGKLRTRIFSESSEFIFQLQTALKRKIRLDNELLDHLFEEDFSRLKSCTRINPLFMAGMKSIIDWVKSIMNGQECYLTASHGDYGYGNILVNRESGELTGVIDWDTGRSNDFPGVDILNLMVQKVRLEKNCGFNKAFVDVCMKVLNGGSLDENGFYKRDFLICGNLLKVIISVCLFRYASRSALYPDIFVMEQQDYQKSLSYLHGIIFL